MAYKPNIFILKYLEMNDKSRGGLVDNVLAY